MKNLFLILGIALVAYGAIGAGSQLGLYSIPGSAGTFFLTSSITDGGNTEITCPAGTVLQNGVCVSNVGGGANYQPTAVYSARDKYSTTAITGSSYYKVGGNSATTTAYSNVNIGDSITYWVSNTSYWMKPVVKTAVQGVNTFEALGWANSTATLSLYDTVNRQANADGAYNTSLGANDQANIEITYQGTSEGSAGPFGGLMVAEYLATISSVTCTGDSLLTSSSYHLTYSASNVSNVHKSWAYGSSLDDGTGAVKRINCQFKNGATTASGSEYTISFIPANYYITSNGDITLDTEKYADGDTTRTGSLINLPTISGYFGA
jgi:hypothetical protein